MNDLNEIKEKIQSFNDDNLDHDGLNKLEEELENCLNFKEFNRNRLKFNLVLVKLKLVDQKFDESKIKEITDLLTEIDGLYEKESANIYESLAIMHLMEKKNSQAFFYLEKASDFYSRTRCWKESIIIDLEIAQLFVEMGKIKQAIDRANDIQDKKLMNLEDGKCKDKILNNLAIVYSRNLDENRN